MAQFNESTVLELSYAKWETKIGSNPVHFVQQDKEGGGAIYIAVTGDANNQFWSNVVITADVTDFETDHKPGGTAQNRLQDCFAQLVGLKRGIDDSFDEFRDADVVITYNAAECVATIVETGRTKTRTSTYIYDASDRLTSVTVVIT